MNLKLSTMLSTPLLQAILTRIGPAIAAGLTSLTWGVGSAQSAETIYIDYGLVGQSLPVASLEAYAADGTVDAHLAPYLNLLSPELREELQMLLDQPLSALIPENSEVAFHPFALSQWLYSPMGEQVMVSTGHLLQTHHRLNGASALRSAMVLAAADPAGLSIINLLRYWPTESVRLDLPRLQQLLQAAEFNSNATDQLIATMSQMTTAAAAAEPAMDYGSLPLLTDVAPFGVIEQTLIMEDPERQRTFPVDLYRPDDADAPLDRLPVMIVSHGYGDTRQNIALVALARGLAASGFVVALPEHIGSNGAYQDQLAAGLVGESFQVMEFVNRPLDIRFVLDTLESINANDFAGRLQLEQVGVVGHSFGGYTALTLAGAKVDIPFLQQQCQPDGGITPNQLNISLLLQCRLLELNDSPATIQALTAGRLADERVGLVVAVATLSQVFGPQGLSQLQIPVVLTGGEYDIAAPMVLEQVNAFQQLTMAEKYFYSAENISHNQPLTRLVMNLLYPETDAARSFDTVSQAFSAKLQTLIIAHGQVHLRGEDAYRPYLTSSYVQTASIELVKIHLVRSLLDEFGG